MNRLIRWRGPIILSLVIHLVVAAAALFLIPEEKKERQTPFVTQLVSPDELESGRQGLPEASRPGRPGVPGTVLQPPRATRPSPPRPLRPSPLPEGPARSTAPLPGTQEPPTAEGIPGLPAVPGKPGEDVVGRSGGEGYPRRPSEGKKAPAPSLRERLFDREVVEQFAKREERDGDKRITFDTEEFRYRTYMLRLKDRIESIWKYPHDAAMRGIYGDLEIRFTIRKNGMLGEVELLRTSGHRSLDQAALQALKDAQPFWPLPDEWGRDDLPITGHFVYTIYGSYLR